MANIYQNELDEFRRNFECFRDKRIVLYGIGRYTATLVEGIDDYNFVGLMDKDPKKIGETVFGLEIVAIEKAESIADIIIINTSETFWNVIFNRISDSRIPVFYKNGERAKVQTKENEKYPYDSRTILDIETEIDDADIISFDFFDTLFERLVMNPKDIVLQLGYSQDLRAVVIGCLQENYTYCELYDEIEKRDKNSLICNDRNREIALEHGLLRPREAIFELYKKCNDSGRDVYIISDMYLPREFYLEQLKLYGINFLATKLLISCELDRQKRNGTIFQYFKDEIVKKKRAVHIGDNIASDFDMPKKYGINACYVPSKLDLIMNSSLKGVMSQCGDFYSTILFGLIFSHYYKNPFRDVKSKGKVHIEAFEEMGYMVFGPLISTFFLWLDNEVTENGTDKLFFLARDGYLLIDDYRYYCEKLGKEAKSDYLMISRQIAITASCRTRDDVIGYLKRPYSGSLAQLFEDRLGIVIQEKADYSIEDYVDEQWDDIERYVATTRREYLRYLREKNFTDGSAIVDQGYYGNNQKHLGMLLGRNIDGYYFCANMCNENENTAQQKMKACFQEKTDKSAENSGVFKYMIFLESFMTAPYGMIRSMNNDGKFVHAANGENQRYFEERERINRGVQLFISDFLEIIEGKKYEINANFVSEYYKACFDGRVGYSEEIRKIFYNDNAMMNRLESNLFR